MHLSRLYISGYRSIDELDLNLKAGKNVIVGRNNAGKSNIIKALNIVLGERDPTYARSEAFSTADLRTWRELHEGEIISETADQAVIWCELVRGADEELDYKSLYNGRGFYRYLGTHEGSLCSIKSGVISSNSHPKHVAAMLLEMEPDPVPREWVSAKAAATNALEKEFDGAVSFVLLFTADKSSQAELEKKIYFLYGNAVQGWKVCFKAPYRTELLQSAIIPSFRDPTNQLRASAWTWYGKLLQHLTNKPEKNLELKDALKGVQEIADAIFTEVRDDLSNSALSVAFPGTDLHFQFNPDVGVDLYKSCTIYADDGCKSPLQDKGSGIQSATIIGLFAYYVRNVHVAGAALLCVEEPELYLHPHARRVINSRLDDFVAQGANQVIVTTHSPEFVRSSEDTLNVALVRKEDQATRAITVPVKSHKHLLIAPNMAEIFFAEKAIFVEGYDEFLLRMVADDLLGDKLDARNVSIIAVAGKAHFKQMIELALKLKVEAYILCDFDFLLRDKSAEADKYGAKKHPDLTSLGASFFAQRCLFGSEGVKVHATLQKLRTRVKKVDEKGFYTAKDLKQVSVPLESELQNLRSHGIGILNGEIENLFIDPQFCSSTNKFDLEKAAALHVKLAKGEHLKQILNTEPIETFLNRVLA